MPPRGGRPRATSPSSGNLERRSPRTSPTHWTDCLLQKDPDQVLLIRNPLSVRIERGERDRLGSLWERDEGKAGRQIHPIRADTPQLRGTCVCTCFASRDMAVARGLRRTLQVVSRTRQPKTQQGTREEADDGAERSTNHPSAARTVGGPQARAGGTCTSSKGDAKAWKAQEWVTGGTAAAQASPGHSTEAVLSPRP
eukprot:scaffold967_cov321-Pavlova_lutheri.AAC.38